MKQNQNQKNNLIHIGDIVNTHGIKGELRILSDSSDPESRFSKGSIVFYKENEKLIPLTITSMRFHKNFILVMIDDYTNINEVEFLKGKNLFVERTDEDELINDMIGYKVFDKNLGSLGELESFIDLGQYESMIVKNNDKKINIPYLDKFVKEINEKEQTIEVEIPKEFLN